MRIALYRYGRLVAERSNLLDCLFTGQPAQEATYRAEVNLQQDDSFLPLSSRTSMAWTFKSSQVDGVQPLPLMTVSCEWTPASTPTAPPSPSPS